MSNKKHRQRTVYRDLGIEWTVLDMHDKVIETGVASDKPKAIAAARQVRIKRREDRKAEREWRATVRRLPKDVRQGQQLLPPP